MPELKLTLKYPLVPGGELTLSVSVAEVVRLIKALLVSKPQIRDQDVVRLIERSVRDIVADQWVSGDARGGWGHDYESRYFADLFGPETPSDSVVHPHSLSFSLWVLEGIEALTSADAKHVVSLSGHAKESWIMAIRDYFLNHYDPATGGAGPKWSATDQVKRVAPNMRHAAASMCAFLALPACLSEVEGTARYIINSLRSRPDLTAARGITIASLLRALYTIESQPLLRSGLLERGADLRALISWLEIELVTHYDESIKIWDAAQPGAQRCNLWYSALVLRSIPEIQESNLADLRALYADVLNGVLLSAITAASSGVGIPYIPTGTADVGLSATLINILANDTCMEPRRRAEVSSELYRFLLYAHGNPEYTRYTYSWTWAMVLRAFSPAVLETFAASR